MDRRGCTCPLHSFRVFNAVRPPRGTCVLFLGAWGVWIVPLKKRPKGTQQ